VADDLIAGLVIQVGADLSELEAEIASAQASLLNLAASVDDLGGKSAEAGSQFAGLQDALGETTAKTAETEEASVGLGTALGELAGEGVGNLTEKLLELGAALGISFGMFELAKGAIEVYANIQRATESLTALTGSAQTATDTLERLRALALDNAISFEALVTANQRMVAFGFSASQIPGALQAVIDASRAAHVEFEAAANALDRIALSGMASGRILATLGLSVQDLAAAMGLVAGTAVATITSTFRALDVSDRLAVITDALQKYKGLGEATANDLIGSWTNLKNQINFALDEMGKALAPLSSEFMSAFADAVPSLKAFAEALVPALSGLKDIGVAAGNLLGPITQLMSMFLSGGNLIAIGTAFGFVGATLAALTETAFRSVLLIRDIPMALIPLSGGLEKMLADFKAGAQDMQQVWVDNFKTIAQQGDEARTKFDALTTSTDKLKTSTEAVHAAIALLPATFTDASDTFKRLYADYESGTGDSLALANAQKVLETAYDELNPKQKELAGGFKDMPEAIRGSTEAQKVYLEAIKSTNDGTAEYNLELRANAENVGTQVALLIHQAAALQDSARALDSAGISSDDLNIRLQDTNSLLIDMTANWRDNVTRVLGDFDDKLQSVNHGTIQWAKSLDALEKATGTGTSSTGVTKAMKDLALTIPDARKEGGQFFDTIQLHLPDLSELEEHLRKDNIALEDLRQKSDAAGASTASHIQYIRGQITALQDSIPWLQATGQNTADVRQKIEDLTLSLQTNYDKWYSVGRQINQVITNDLTRALTDVIFQVGNIADAFKRMGESIVSIILNRIIIDALHPLLKELDGVIAKVGDALSGLLGIGTKGAGGVLGTTVGSAGGAAGTIGNGIDLGQGSGSAGGGAAGAASAIVGSAVTSIVTAISSAIGALAGVGSFITSLETNSKLATIEGETRFTMIYTETILELHQETNRVLYAIHSALIDYVSAHIDFVLTELQAFHKDMLGGVTPSGASSDLHLDLIAIESTLSTDMWGTLKDISHWLDVINGEFVSFAVQLLSGIKGGTLGGSGTGTGTTGAGPNASPGGPAVVAHDAAWVAANLTAMYAYIDSVTKPAQEAMKQLADITSSANVARISSLGVDSPGLQAMFQGYTSRLQDLLKTPGLTPDMKAAIQRELSDLISGFFGGTAPHQTINLTVDGQTLATAVVSYLEGSGTKT
jgi:hypothetical protein